MKRWRMNGVGSLLRDERGNFAILTGAAASMLALAVGFGINITQAYNVRSNLRNALDAAVTSTARDLTTGRIDKTQARQLVASFLEANGDTRFVTSDAYVLDSLVVDDVARTLEASAYADVESAFPLFGSKTQRVEISSAAVFSDRKVEVAMMLDTTGSMQGRKIQDLKTAAANAVKTILDGEDPSKPRTRVAIVPYAEAVNVGKLAGDAVFVEKAGGSDLPPPVDAPVQVSSSASRPDTCATERKDKDGLADFSDAGPFTERRNNQGKTYLAMVNRDDRLSVCPAASVVPLTADKTKLLAAINAFKASGVTAGAIAAQWGSYMLSPDWRSTIRTAGLGNGPADYDTRSVRKVAILMTDGQFNTAFAGVTGKPQMVQGDKSRAYAEAICTNMKQRGIEVFTIGFDLNAADMSATERQQAKAVLKACASPDTQLIQHYFEASTGAELDAAFQDIIRNTEVLALTK
jgi:Flp pilus assembly protein TadG